MGMPETNGECQVVGVDIGGTFIDYAVVDGAGRLTTSKHLSDPSALADAFLAGLAAAAPAGARRLVHGTTVATNALLERRGATTGLLATEGFADVLAIGRQNRPKLYALHGERLPALVPAELRLEARERVSASGQIMVELDEESVERAAEAFAAAGVEAVAVSFLFSFLRPEHEQRAGAILRERLGEGVPVYLSSDVLPEFREYERFSTTVATAYVGPLVDRYLGRVAEKLDGKLEIMQSNGGVLESGEAVRRAAGLILSGPAAGVVGAFDAATRAGFDQVLTFDMGGTSTDVSLCPGEILTMTEASVADVPIRLPMIDIHTVGAGGGSIARRDAGGALRVGPESAGADPGPACYGRGELATVTDANVVLGRIPVDSFLGGRLPLDRGRAEAALGRLGAELGLDVETTALGIVSVVNASMQRAVRRVSVERGFDPRRFVLVAFGGAGPLHAAELAEELEIGRVLVPRFPGVQSALGMATADEIRDWSRTVKVRFAPGADLGMLAELWQPLEEQAAALDEPTLERTADVCYVGQSYELEVAADDLTLLPDAFAAAHERLYGFFEPARAMELVNVRLRARRPRAPHIGDVDGAGPGDERTIPVRFAGGWLDTTQLGRGRLHTGDVVRGPALIGQSDTATLVPPGWLARVGELGDLLLERTT
jgi:N-methylhydantoinase A